MIQDIYTVACLICVAIVLVGSIYLIYKGH